MITTTHLNFAGDARAALEFYHSVFGGELRVTSYAELGMPAEAPGASRVVFGALAEGGIRLMAYDTLDADAAGLIGGTGSTRRANGTTLTTQPFFVSLDGASLDEVQQVWAALAAGGAVLEPLAASAWSAGFGMLTDRFGVTWTLTVTPPA